MKKEIILSIGPTKEHPLYLEIREDDKIVGGTYCTSITDLLGVLMNMEDRNELPWRK